jgi:hypothetical protein
MKPLLPLALLSLVLVGCGAKPEVASGPAKEPELKPGQETAPKEDVSLELPKPENEESNLVSKENPLADLSLHGTYSGKVDFPPGFFEEMRKQAGQNGLTEEQIDKFEAGLVNSQMTLNLKSDGTYVLSSDSMGISETRTGEWNYDPKAEVLTVGAAKEDPEAKPKVFIVGDQGKTLTFVGDKDGFEVKITFTRA